MQQPVAAGRKGHSRTRRRRSLDGVRRRCRTSGYRGRGLDRVGQIADEVLDGCFTGPDGAYLPRLGQEHRHGIDRAFLDDHQGLRPERFFGESRLDRLLHLRRQSAGRGDAPGIGHADRTIGSDLLIRDRDRPPPAGRADSLGRKRLAGARPILLLWAARFRWPARGSEFALRPRLRGKRLDPRPPASPSWSRGRLAEQPARGAFPNHYRDGIADRDLDLRRLDILFEAKRKPLLWLGDQGVDHPAVDRDDIEKDLASSPPLFENIARRWSRPRDPGASANR